jgi:hypothetical protein
MANTLRFKRGLASGIPTAVAGEPLFTTDTFDLYIGNGTTNTRFQKYIASGTTSQLLRGDGSLLTMPIVLTSPANGQVLKFNGTSWVNDSDSGITGSGAAGQVAYFTGATTQGGSNNLFWDNTNGRLGVGLSTPSVRLEVSVTGNNGIRIANTGNTGSDFSVLDFVQGGSQKAVIYTNNNNTVFNATAGALIFQEGGAEAARIFATGNFGINTGATDSGQRLQVVGDTLLRGSGNTSATTALTVQSSTASTLFSVRNDGEVSINGNLTVSGGSFITAITFQTSNTALPLLLNGFVCRLNLTPTSGTTAIASFLTTTTINQTGTATGITRGLYVNPTLISAADWRSIEWSNSTGWGLYGAGTANNYMAGSLGVGATTLTQYNLRVSKNISGATVSYGIVADGQVQSTVTVGTINIWSNPSVAASTTSTNLYHFRADQGTFGAGSTVTNQIGFWVDSSLTGATNNFGFRSEIASATNRWNFYANGTALNYFNGNTLIGSTTDSGEKLQVTGTMKVTGATTLGATTISTSSSTALAINSSASSCYLGMSDSSGSFTYLGSDNGAMLFQTPASSYSTKMTLDASGNLGLGVTPNTWSAAWKALQIQTASFAALSSQYTFVGQNFYNDGTSKFIGNGRAALYQQYDGVHSWYYTANNTSGAGAATSFTQAMTLDASGNLLVGSTSAGSSTTPVNISLGSAFGSNTAGSTANLKLRLYDDGVAANHYGLGVSGSLLEISAPSSLAFFNGASASRTERMRINANGRVLIGSSSDSGETFQVTGTAKITGATSIVNDTNAAAGLSILNPNTGTSAISRLNLGSANSNWFFDAVRIGGNLSIKNNISGSPVELLSITNGGNLAVDTNTLFVDATNNRVGIGTITPSQKLDVSGTINIRSAIPTLLFDRNSSYTWRMVNGDGSTFPLSTFNIANNASTAVATFTDAGNLGIGMTPAYKLDVTGSARISDAIAIGTTPDTNNPFKILKNINSTVGIRFENTNTSSAAFSAVQLGTDITGGTKFTNLVYSSSGVVATGVYNPDGTSLINNGSGGLNFLGTPFRIYTGTGNGTLRILFDNEGTTQINATTPTTNAVDGYKQYSADVTAGNAAPHFRTENGAVIKLYQETTSVGNSIFSQGGGNSVLDDSTFDGYTLRQIVKALRNQGILA